MTEPSTVVATRDEQQAVERSPQSVLQVFSSSSFKQQIAAALPAHIGVDSMMRIALTEVRMNPELQKCTVPSFMGAMLKAAQSGLRPGMFGEGWILPRWNNKLKSLEAQFQPGYMGLAQLAYRSGEVREVHAVAVYAADHFRYQLGSDPKIEHVPDMEAEHDPADIVAFYAVVKLVNGGTLMKVMRRDDVDDIRDRFGPRNRDGQLVGPWVTDYEAMGCKTVLIQALKLAPKESERLQFALQAEQDAVFGDRVAAGVVERRAPVAERVAERIGLRDAREEVVEAEVAEPEDTPVPEPSDAPAEAPRATQRPQRRRAQPSPSELAAQVAAKAAARESGKCVTRQQANMLYTQQTAMQVSDEERDAYLSGTLGVASFEQVPQARLDEVVAWLKGYPTDEDEGGRP